ncbi:MAG TPA: RagB/SusD family nutrient uptake outer membrane protein [Ferruginibacter sp.]|nr:RagB/SusD family nutrient uptake outer membrane protein [Ferruginibacter sp.]HPH90081.1 RagB/SusD family nutrient uptake outer membrane protein [Ferruginibacter sp.]
MNKTFISVFFTLLITGACMLLATGCKKYLTEEPETEFVSSDAFSSNDSALKVVLASYNQMGGDPGYGIRLSIYYPMGSDECMNPSENNDGGRRSMSRYELDAGNIELSRPYRQLYRGIEIANHCIDNIPLMASYKGEQGDDKQKEARRMYGEALTLRAQFYLTLITVWGDVPAPMVPAFKNPEEFPQKQDRDLIYEKLLQDLAVAKEHLPWRDEVTPDERITKSAAMALRARMALCRAGWSLRRSPVQMKQGSDPATYYTIARDECKELIESGKHSLVPDFKSLFKDYVCGVQTPVDPAGEIIFQVGMSGGSAIADSKFGYANGPRAINSAGTNTGNGFVIILPTAYYQFDSIDTRRDVSVAPYDVNQNGTKKGSRIFEIRDGKFRREWITPAISNDNNGQYFGVNWPIIRYADVLLMFAEAENELNGSPTAAALAAFETVRKRGFRGNEGLIGTTPIAKAGFFNAIVNERFLEFMGEGLRKYDLIRWNLLGAKIQETKTNLRKMAYKEPPYENLPSFMYFINSSTADDGTIWANSLYWPGPTGSSSIPGATRVNWVRSSSGPDDPELSTLITTTLARYAIGFTANKHELFPIHQSDISQGKIPQDYGY